MSEQYLLKKLNLVTTIAIISIIISLFIVISLQKLSWGLAFFGAFGVIIHYFLYKNKIKSNTEIMKINRKMSFMFVYSLLMPFLFLLVSYIFS
ncbi:hypothetical protein DY138_03160 [Apilactobacillus timberlakei]|uniref:hypothetical protein n=1 Tax=Apilactobacillus timberlakei TaxID=2008380 RepID=UPI00112C7D94|nr:hypothetical protein [Apilactobacillus timberlakei]TPR19660.1 hypothetical protein DY138_03160 [Apilactobacillus timberlakei]TPR20637.1 hypothetical protein DY061_04800 [Apilactobacillus timberlakei]TPR22680.1 hypothetical protein DY083_04070 [Apilactobacillus timberlakei]